MESKTPTIEEITDTPQLKHIPQPLKFMFISIGLGISAMIMAFLTPLVDTRTEARWLTNIMFAFFVFSNIFTVLAISSYFSEIRGE